MPSMLYPVIPGIPEPPSRGKKPKTGKNCGRAENFLNKGETILRQAMLKKKKKMLLTTNIVAIFTSAKRTFFLNERFTKEVDNDLEVVKGAKITIEDSSRKIEVVDRRGNRRELTFIDYSDFRLFSQEYNELAFP